MKILKLIALLAGLLPMLATFGQTTKIKDSPPAQASDLYLEIRKQDSALFAAFNTLDSVNYKKYFTDDLEFYHDTGGLTVSLEGEMRSFREMYERRANGVKVRRELIISSLEVHPIANYGAIQIASHNFYFTRPGQVENLGGTYKFVHVWKLDNGQWKISRVVSYGHNPKS